MTSVTAVLPHLCWTFDLAAAGLKGGVTLVQVAPVSTSSGGHPTEWLTLF